VEFLVRPAEELDLGGIVEVYNHYVVHTPMTFDTAPAIAQDRRAWFDEHRREGPHRLIVAVDRNRRVLGWASTSSFRPRAAYATTVEASVYCRAGFTRLGIGSRLYSSLFDSIASEDVERIVAGITLPNPASVALHRNFGFQPVGTFTRVGRKFGEYWDVAWFERPLRTDPAAGPRRDGTGPTE
jgi:phosphinothricin acetyltransferase